MDQRILPQRWCIWFAVEGDLRFLSHHETMRTIERIATRASLPLRYTQGFNPHPVMSLAAPRPTGVASRNDLLVVSLEETPQGHTADTLLGRINEQAPTGMKFFKAAPLTAKTTPLPVRITHELVLQEEQTPPVADRLEQLGRMDAWPLKRYAPPKRSGKRRAPRTIDIKTLIVEIGLIKAPEPLLRWIATQADGLWARPGEVLRLVGLDERTDLARVRRAEIEYTGVPTSPM